MQKISQSGNTVQILMWQLANQGATCFPPENKSHIRLEVLWLHTFFLWVAPVSNQTLSYWEPSYLLCFSAAYWSLIQQTTSLFCQHEVLTLSVEYIKPKTCQIHSWSMQRIIETHHTYRISAKSPVLKIFIMIHILMELLNLLRRRSPETTSGVHTVVQSWHGFPLESEGRETVTPSPSTTLQSRNFPINTITLNFSCWLDVDILSMT